MASGYLTKEHLAGFDSYKVGQGGLYFGINIAKHGFALKLDGAPSGKLCKTDYMLCCCFGYIDKTVPNAVGSYNQVFTRHRTNEATDGNFNHCGDSCCVAVYS